MSYRHQGVGERKPSGLRGAKAFWTAVGVLTAGLAICAIVVAVANGKTSASDLALLLVIGAGILLGLAAVASTLPAGGPVDDWRQAARIYTVERDPDLSGDSIRLAAVAFVSAVLLSSLALALFLVRALLA